MKKILLLIILGTVIPVLFMAFTPKEKSFTPADEYIVIAWNDLGMHCANLDFQNLCILPPYNNQMAQVILQGAIPTLMSASSGIYVTYQIPGNTYSVGKTNFWTYANTLFGVTLAPNVGLAGFGLTGTMTATDTYHHAEGIPITAYRDATPSSNPDPYQLLLVQAFSSGSQFLDSTTVVIPVSHEINCVSSGCHSSEMNILNMHETVPGFDPNNRPILCANCHGDPALGKPKLPGYDYFSQVIHRKHGSFINTGTISDCYKCHPGPNTQCLRDYMHTIGKICQDCHGSVSNVGSTIAGGRIPWVQEPSCGNSGCHDANHSEPAGQLYRQSKGHGGIYCSACHGSPHAIQPTNTDHPRDNYQNIALQGFSGPLKKCEVCHGYIPSGPGPHGYNPTGIEPVNANIPLNNEILQNYPNPASRMTHIPFHISSGGAVSLTVYNIHGEKVQTLVNKNLQPGEYNVELYTEKIPTGTYICCLEVNGGKYCEKIAVVKDF